MHGDVDNDDDNGNNIDNKIQVVSTIISVQIKETEIRQIIIDISDLREILQAKNYRWIYFIFTSILTQGNSVTTRKQMVHHSRCVQYPLQADDHDEYSATSAIKQPLTVAKTNSQD